MHEGEDPRRMSKPEILKTKATGGISDDKRSVEIKEVTLIRMDMKKGED